MSGRLYTLKDIKEEMFRAKEGIEVTFFSTNNDGIQVIKLPISNKTGNIEKNIENTQYVFREIHTAEGRINFEEQRWYMARTLADIKKVHDRQFEKWLWESDFTEYEDIEEETPF